MEDKTIVTTLRAERGGKFDEDKQCIGSYQRSIVFMPREVQPDQMVRVRLIPILDRATGKERTDKGGRVMYRAQLAPAEIPERCEWEIAEKAAALRKAVALPRGEGEAILRAKHGVLPNEWTGYDWYYFFADATFGSKFSPAALLVLEGLPVSTGSAYRELLGWILGGARGSGDFFHHRQAGQVRDGELPEFPETELREIVSRLEKGEWVIADLLERRL